ncbi:MAG: flippase-like domain-containing protein [Candidatus Methylarchaceae archaeon HK02M1]|nr:flippase-like domain-containing protein [Candidatus Methylarchaceae archaeon HK02M1]
MKLKIILSMLLGFILLIFIVLQIDLGKLYDAIIASSPIWLVYYLLLMVPFFLIRAWRWRILLTPIKKSVKLSSTFWITMVGFMVNALIPLRLGGEFVRAFAMDGKEKTGFFGTLSSVAVERVLDLFGITILGLIGIFLIPKEINMPNWFMDSLKIVGIFVVIALMGLLLGTKYDRRLLGLIKRVILAIPKLPYKWQEKIINFSKSIIDGAKGLSHNFSALFFTLISTLVIWGMASLSSFLIFKAFNYDVPITIILLGSMLVQLSFILPAPPGYIGTYEAFWMAIFIGLGLSNINLIFTTAIVSHLLSNTFIITTGSIGVASMGLSFEKVMKMKSIS